MPSKIKFKIHGLTTAYQTVLKRMNFIKNFDTQLLMESVGLSMAIASPIPVAEAGEG
jgi:hypothetical protein